MRIAIIEIYKEWEGDWDSPSRVVSSLKLGWTEVDDETYHLLRSHIHKLNPNYHILVDQTENISDITKAIQERVAKDRETAARRATRKKTEEARSKARRDQVERKLYSQLQKKFGKEKP